MSNKVKGALIIVGSMFGWLMVAFIAPAYTNQRHPENSSNDLVQYILITASILALIGIGYGVYSVIKKQDSSIKNL